MLFLRSLVFNILWYINIILQMVLQTPFYFFLTRKAAMEVPRRWALSAMWLQKVIVGARSEISGVENVPEGGCIIASKHQSLWEFYSLYTVLGDVAFVLKSELMKIPFFGWYLAKVDQIPIVRKGGAGSVRSLIDNSKPKLLAGRRVLIFPEGTRREPGAEPAYRSGLVKMYMDLNYPVVPVAINSGLYWARRKFLRHPGIIRARFLEPIMPGLSAEEFSKELETRIEEACDELYLQSSLDPVSPPLSEKVLARIELAKARRSENKSS